MSSLERIARTGALLLATVTTVCGQISVKPGTTLLIENGTSVEIQTAQQTLVVMNGAELQNDGTILLGEEASISEVQGFPIHGSGTEVITKTYNSSLSNENPGALGCELTTNSIIGTLTLTRGHVEFQNDLSDLSVKRWYNAEPDVNGGLDLTLRFHYDDLELNSNTETDLELNRSLNNGVNWTIFTSSVNTTDNYVQAQGIDSLGTFTLFAPGLGTSIEPGNNEGAVLTVFPNPTSGRISILARNVNDPVTALSIIDMQGRTVWQKDVSLLSGHFEIDGTDWSEGLYQIEIVDHYGTRSSAKFILEK